MKNLSISTQTIVLEHLHKSTKDVLVGIQLDLTGTIEKDVVVVADQFVELLLKPTLVLEQVLHTK